MHAQYYSRLYGGVLFDKCSDGIGGERGEVTCSLAEDRQRGQVHERSRRKAAPTVISTPASPLVCGFTTSVNNSCR